MTSTSQKATGEIAAQPPQRVFIVYGRADKAWVLGYLVPALQAAGVPLSTEEDFPPGSAWRDAALEVISGASRVILVLSKAFVSERKLRWIELAASHRSVEEQKLLLLPIQLEPVDLGLALGMLVLLDATDPEHRAQVVERVCRELGHPAPPTAPPPCPYPGMTAYTGDPGFPFFGREPEIAAVVDRLTRQRRVALMGPSGSGKSSLLLAGVVPRLEQEGWHVAVMRPAAAPVAALSTALAALDGAPGSPRLLVVDQLEEIFAAPVADAEQFVHTLVTEVERGQIAMALTARADFLARFMESSSLWGLVGDHRVEVLPLRDDSLAAAITGPAEDVGVYVDPVLTERLVNDAEDEPGRMPLLQETLRLLWGSIEQRYLPLHAYTALSDGEGDEARRGLHVALARNADAAWNTLDEPDRSVARRVLIRLVQLGQGGPDVRRQVPLADLRASDDDPAAVDRVVAVLVRSRILTTGSADDGGQQVVVDIAHEALITRWPTFARWLRQHRAAEHLRRELERNAKQWEARGSGASGLLDEGEVIEAERWLAGSDPARVGVGQEIRALVTASRSAVDAQRAAAEAARTRELAQQKAQAERDARSARRFRSLTIGLVVLLVAALGAGSWAAIQQRRAVAERQQARAAELAGAAAGLSGPAVDRAAVLALAGDALDQSTSTRAGLLSALTMNPRLRREIFLTGSIETLAASSDGRLVAAGMTNGEVVVLDPRTGSTSAEITLPSGSSRSVAFSPDGTTIAVGADDGVVTRWDTETGAAAGAPLNGHSLGVRAVTYSPDGSLLASAGVDARVVVWRLDGTEPDRILEGHTDWVNALAFSPDGATLYSGAGASEGESRDRRVLAWDMVGGADAPRLIGEHTDAVRSIAVSPDGLRVASAGADDVVRVWDAATGTPLVTATGHTERIYAVAFSPDGKQLFSAARDRTVRRWDAATGAPLGEPLRGHELAVHGIVSVDADTAVSAGSDGRVVVWDVSADPPPRLVDVVSDIAEPVGVSGDGRLLATADPAGSVVVRELGSWNAVGPGLAVGGPVDALALDRDGATCVVVRGGQLQLWDVAGGRLSATVDVGSDVKSLAVAPDGKVAAGTAGGSIHVFGSGLSDEVRLDGHSTWVTGVAFAGDGELVSVDAAGDAYTWPLAEPAERRRFTGGTGQFTALAASPDGRVVVAGDTDGRLQTVDFSRSDGVHADRVVIAHDARVTALAFAADGTTLVSADADGSVALWAVAGPVLTPIGPQRDAGEAVGDADFGAGSARLITSGTAGVWLWNDDPTDWRRELCAVAGRDLTSDERLEFEPDLDEVDVCPDRS